MHVGVGVVGFGYWGPNLARNLEALSDVRLVGIADPAPDCRASAARSHPGARIHAGLDELLGDPDVEAVALATPAAAHFEHARRVLDTGRHVLVEKPLALSVRECDELIATADRQGTVLMVGHTFLYNSAVRWFHDYLARGEAGDVRYVHSERLNLGRVRDDVSVLWNLAPHDLAMLLYLLDGRAATVRAHGLACLQDEREDVVFLTVEMADGVLGHVHVSWLDPQKVRRVTVVGSQTMVVFDDVDVERPIQVFDRGIDVIDGPGDTSSLGEFRTRVRTGDLLVPRIDSQEPLALECQEFVDAILHGAKPLADGAEGRRVVAILEAAQSSLRRGGVSVPITP